MTTSKRLRPSRVEWLIVVLITAALIAILYPVVLTVRNPRGPFGAIIPQETPIEANRVGQSTGLSIVAPVNWDVIRDRPDMKLLTIAPRGAPGRRLKGYISISPLDDNRFGNGFSAYSKTMFLGFPAFEKRELVRKSTFDDPADSRYELLVNRNEEWWQIEFRAQSAMRELPPQIRDYLLTVRFPEAR